MTNAAANETLDDLAGRIEYAFYAADSRSLQQGVQQLEALELEPADRALRDGHVNYARWKLAQLLAANDPTRAQAYAEACASSETSTGNAAMLARHHAVVAACFGLLEMLRPVRRMLYRDDRQSALRQALQAGGDAPPVLLAAAWLALQLESSDAAYPLLVRALGGFAATSRTGADWGHAETCYLLGKIELMRGNALAARNALEQALVHAPDYRDAQQVLRSLSVQ